MPQEITPEKRVLYITILIAVLAVAAAVRTYRRIRKRVGSVGIDDAQIRRIEDEGSIELDEPLDREEIRDAEERFWEETWDEPEEW